MWSTSGRRFDSARVHRTAISEPSSSPNTLLSTWLDSLVVVCPQYAGEAQVVERLLGMQEDVGSTPITGSGKSEGWVRSPVAAPTERRWLMAIPT